MAVKWGEHNQAKWSGIRPGIDGDQVLVPFNTNVNTTLYTVAADKILLLTDWCLGVTRNKTVETALTVRDNTAAVQAYIAKVSTMTAAPGGSLFGSTFFPIELIVAWDIRLNAAGETCTGYIHGILVDA